MSIPSLLIRPERPVQSGRKLKIMGKFPTPWLADAKQRLMCKVELTHKMTVSSELLHPGNSAELSVNQNCGGEVMRVYPSVALAIGVVILGSGPVLAAGMKDQPRPQLYATLESCRAISADAERLSCFDSAMKQLNQAIASKEVLIVDKAQIEKTKRGLFGLKLPNLGLFADKDDAAEEGKLSQIESKVQSVRANGEGWLLILEDGSMWQQTDGVALAISPKKGMTVVVKLAALGSYKMSVDKQPSIRVRRVV